MSYVGICAPYKLPIPPSRNYFTSGALSATHRLSQSRCSLISTDKVFCGCFPCEFLCQPPFGRISRKAQRPCYDSITVFDFCGTNSTYRNRTENSTESLSNPLTVFSLCGTSIVCLQGLCMVQYGRTFI